MNFGDHYSMQCWRSSLHIGCISYITVVICASEAVAQILSSQLAIKLWTVSQSSKTPMPYIHVHQTNPLLSAQSNGRTISKTAPCHINRNCYLKSRKSKPTFRIMATLWRPHCLFCYIVGIQCVQRIKKLGMAVRILVISMYWLAAEVLSVRVVTPRTLI